jgi:hypothetical protein
MPLYALSGIIDPIVPWWFVRPWLRKNCSALREYHLVWKADHNVLGTNPGASAERVLQWMATVASSGRASVRMSPD